MRAEAALREVLASTWARKTSTVLVAVLVGAMCLTTLLTVGRSAAAEAQVAERMEAAGARVVTIRDESEDGLVNPGTVAVVAGLDGVEAAVGVGIAFDVTNGASGEIKAPAREVAGDLGGVIRLADGRWPRPGEALISASAQNLLGMESPFGHVTDGIAEYAVVGRFSTTGASEDLDDGIVINANGGEVANLRLLAADASQVDAVTGRAIAMLAPSDPGRLQVEAPVTLAEVQQDVVGDLAQYSRTLLIGVLLAGGVLVTVVVLADVLLRRSDLGRRRALGATRTVIVTLVTGQVVLAGGAGALLGSVVGALWALRLSGLPPKDFIAGTAILAILTALAGSVPPALLASVQDPVAVLRTP